MKRRKRIPTQSKNKRKGLEIGEENGRIWETERRKRGNSCMQEKRRIRTGVLRRSQSRKKSLRLSDNDQGGVSSSFGMKGMSGLPKKKPNLQTWGGKLSLGIQRNNPIRKERRDGPSMERKANSTSEREGQRNPGSGKR